jgi:hypothetical protein
MNILILLKSDTSKECLKISVKAAQTCDTQLITNIQTMSMLIYLQISFLTEWHITNITGIWTPITLDVHHVPSDISYYPSQSITGYITKGKWLPPITCEQMYPSTERLLETSEECCQS